MISPEISTGTLSGTVLDIPQEIFLDLHRINPARNTFGNLSSDFSWGA